MQPTPKPKRQNSRLILATAALTFIFAAAAAWNTYHDFTAFNTATAAFISLAAIVELFLAHRTRRNEERSAHYRSLINQLEQSKDPAATGAQPPSSCHGIGSAPSD